MAAKICSVLWAQQRQSLKMEIALTINWLLIFLIILLCIWGPVEIEIQFSHNRQFCAISTSEVSI